MNISRKMLFIMILLV